MTGRLWRRALRAAVTGTFLALLAVGCGGDSDGGGGIAAVGDAGGDTGAAAEVTAPCGGCPEGKRCDEAADACVDCLRDEHCADGERCDDHVCAPVVCEPGSSTCEDGRERRCNPLGTAWDETTCGPEQVCGGGVCRDRLCEPGATRCQGGLLLTCADSGLSEDSQQCGEGELCVEGEGCTFVRHDLLVIVDTSGSMRRVPEQDDWFDWTEPWPACESYVDPETRIGIARKLFRRLLTEEDAILARSDFALMRFPQFVDGIFVEDPADPGTKACDFGLWQSGSGAALAGDDDSHVTGGDTPAAEGDWFAASLWQALLVPDPRVAGFAALGVDERRESILAYVDGEESAVPGADAVPCELDAGTIQCGLDRPCLGPEGARTCHDVTNPELRAAGQTPIGRTLFYAAEYYRRFVRIEGRPCASDADCGSSNYACEDGVCADPLRRCRKTVVVLITDGTETPNPEDPFFAAPVQARRLHHGLGCEENADCLNGATCEEVRICRSTDPDAPATGTLCETDADCCGEDDPCEWTCAEPVETCATAALLAAGREDGDLAAALAYADPDGAQRVVTEAGEPLPMTVHVVDVAGGSDQNARIADLGGGALLLHSLYDLDALIADLRSVFDIKAGAQCLEE